MVALITGASRGIGAASARKLAKAGYTVAVHAFRHMEQAEALAAELGGMAVCADLADCGEIERMVDEVLSRFGKIDLLVNNAGVSLNGLFQEISQKEAEHLFRVNVGGTLHTTKCVLPSMLRAHSGSIINIASVWGEYGASCEVHYSASKAAIIGFTKALSKETGPSGVRVNCISPGVIDTDMNRMHDSETIHSLAEETPLCRIGTPEEVADGIVFLASPQARFITGAVLPVGGGFTG